jgi:histidyl-tRNA synthetase
LNPYLVRGLDYYTKTVFEIFSTPTPEVGEEKRQPLALAAGGRFDGLVKILGGKEETPACGGAAGIERIIAALKERGKKEVVPATRKVFLAQLGNLPKRKALRLFEEFRKAKVPIAESLGKDSLKTQLRSADNIGANYALILGQKEALEGTIIIRDMRTGRQETVKVKKVVEEIKKRLKK